MITIDDTNLKKRLDVFLFDYLSTNGHKSFSRSFLKENWNELVTVNSKYLKPSYKLKIGDKVEIDMGKVEKLEKSIENSGDIKGEKGDLVVLFEDKDFLVLDKPKGMVVHPGAGNKEGTLANIVRGYLESKNEFDKGVNRAGIVHRLDKGVSGIIIFAKNVESQKFLQEQFEKHDVRKIYLANVIYKESGSPISSYIPENDLDIQEEILKLKENNFECDSTWYKAEGYIKRSNRSRVKMIFQTHKSGNAKYSLSYIKPISKNQVLVMIKTGRMHQIRATLEYLGMNIVGDTLYSSAKDNNMPEEIALRSIFLCFKDIDNKDISIEKI